MKARESGMPEEEMWQQFFDVENILNELEVNRNINHLVDLGAGYGTFTIPAARKINGTVIAYDIEKNLIENLKIKLDKEDIKNVVPVYKDFISEGTGLKNEESDFVMLFNILHAEEAKEILGEAYRILKNGGHIGIIHWIYDKDTPRGPGMEIRPKPEDLKNLLMKNKFSILKYNVAFPPYHYGILAQKKEGDK